MLYGKDTSPATRRAVCGARAPVRSSSWQQIRVTDAPLGKWPARGGVTVARAADPIEYPAGMPGVRVGQ